MIEANKKQQLRLSLIISYMLCFTAILSSVQVIFNVLFRSNALFNSVILYLVYFVLMALTVVNSAINIKKSSLLFIFLISVAYIITIVFFPENMEYMWTSLSDLLLNPTYTLFFFALIGYFFSRKLTDTQLFINIFEKFAIVTITLLAARFFIGFIINSTTPEYMTFSYNLLLPTVFIMLMCIRKYNPIRLIFSGIGGVLILVGGSRGALLGIVISVIVYVLFFGKFERKKKAIIVVALVVTLILLLVFLNPIVNGLVAFLISRGIGSRTLGMILDSSMFIDVSRSNILERVLRNLNPFGHGLWGSRVFMSGSYPHNLLLEILFDFGIILGSILFTAIINLLVRGLRNSDDHYSVLLCALIATGFIKLMFSSSYLSGEASFYVLIGMCANSIKDGKYGNKTSVKKHYYKV